MPQNVSIIGAGLAGSEAALVLAHRGIPVTLYEMRPGIMTPAHETGLPAELVCSNSLKSNLLPSAHGLLKAELAALGSPVLAAANRTSVKAGSALAVDRTLFSQEVLAQIKAEPLISYVERELHEPPPGVCIIASGPLTSDPLAQWIRSTFSDSSLNFYDAIAPIISADSIDMTRAFFASRWEDETADYCNCPFTKDEYFAFVTALLEGEKVSPRQFEDMQFFEACLPVEEIARRGEMSLAFGPLRPIGITNPATGRWPFAVCQLRRENAQAESFNLVGFQTRLSIAEQQRVFRMIPGLAQAEFLRYGSIHRNTYLNSPQLLSDNLSFKQREDLFLAGQITGNEGYTESIATGHLTALFTWAHCTGTALEAPGPTTALGALHRHVTHSPEKRFTPTNINFAILEPLPASANTTGRRKLGKDQKKTLLCERALADLALWKNRFLS